MAHSVPTRPNHCTMCNSREHSVAASGWDFQYATTSQSFDWCRCLQCGHWYINPLPTEEALSLIYPDNLKNYADFDLHPGLAFRVKAALDGRRLRDLAKDTRDGGRLLDVGCAAGMLLDVAKRYCPTLRVLEGTEISHAAASGAIRKGYKVHIGAIETLDLPADYYDLIVMQQVIEHVHNPPAVIAKLRASLRSGGRLVMETPHLWSWDHLLFRSRYWEGYHIPRHFNLWTVDGMRKMVADAGFSDFSFRKRIKPVHWTLSLQNWAAGTQKPNVLVRFFDLRNPLLLAVFGTVDLIQLALFGKASDIQYVATK
jgi:SAM-dependent methyltransferase